MFRYACFLFFILCSCARTESFTQPVSGNNPSSLVFNEILFECTDDQSPWIELYNPSGSEACLSDYRIQIQYSTGRKSSLYPLGDTMVPAFGYAVLASDVSNVVKSEDITVVVDVEKMPSIYKGGGTLILTDVSGNLFELFNYGPFLHNPLLSETTNLSLERINPSLPSDDPASWSTASSLTGGSTPGRKNSQYFPLGISVPTIFKAAQNYRLDFQISSPACVGMIELWSGTGSFVQVLSSWSTLPFQMSLEWVPETVLSPGLYYYRIWSLSPEGRSETYRVPFLL